MVLIISQSDELSKNFIKTSILPIFAYFRTEETLEQDLCIPPRTIIICECGNAERSDRICEKVKELFPLASIGVVLNESYVKTSLFKYVKNADLELISPFSVEKLTDFLKKLNADSNIDRFSPTLTCSPKASALLGYDLDLSQSENRILTFLVAFSEHVCSADLIKEACLLSSASSVRVIIERINKKAKDISGRPLILSHYGKGYSINQNP